MTRGSEAQIRLTAGPTLRGTGDRLIGWSYYEWPQHTFRFPVSLRVLSLWSTEPLGLRASNAALSAPSKLPHPRFQTQYRQQRISGVYFAATVGFEEFDGTFP